MRNIFWSILKENNEKSILFHRSNNLFKKFELKKTNAFGKKSIYQPIFFKKTKQESLDMINVGNYLYECNVDLGKTFNPNDMYNWDHPYNNEYEGLSNLGKYVFEDYLKSDYEKLDHLFYMITAAYDAIENSEFQGWMLSHGYDSFIVSENGKLSQDMSIAVFDPNRIEIINIQKL